MRLAKYKNQLDDRRRQFQNGGEEMAWAGEGKRKKKNAEDGPGTNRRGEGNATKEAHKPPLGDD